MEQTILAEQADNCGSRAMIWHEIEDEVLGNVIAARTRHEQLDNTHERARVHEVALAPARGHLHGISGGRGLCLSCLDGGNVNLAVVSPRMSGQWILRVSSIVLRGSWVGERSNRTRLSRS